MKRSRLSLGLTVIALAACTASDATAPTASAPSAPSSASFDANGAYHDGTIVPGSVGNTASAPTPGQQKRLVCSISAPLYGTATIGAEGGILFVGENMLIVPPGALTKTTTLSGTVAAGNTFQIDFQPHGLQFKKPAGLVLDATSCADAPNVVYLDEQGGVLERITAIFSNWWHRVAAPLDHFSTYAVDV